MASFNYVVLLKPMTLQTQNETWEAVHVVDHGNMSYSIEKGNEAFQQTRHIRLVVSANGTPMMCYQYLVSMLEFPALISLFSEDITSRLVEWTVDALKSPNQVIDHIDLAISVGNELLTTREALAIQAEQQDLSAEQFESILENLSEAGIIEETDEPVEEWYSQSFEEKAKVEAESQPEEEEIEEVEDEAIQMWLDALNDVQDSD